MPPIVILSFWKINEICSGSKYDYHIPTKINGFEITFFQRITAPVKKNVTVSEFPKV